MTMQDFKNKTETWSFSLKIVSDKIKKNPPGALKSITTKYSLILFLQAKDVNKVQTQVPSQGLL